MTSYIYKNEYTTDIKKVCILCVYLHTRHLPAYILHYIKSLKKSGYDTIVVSHSQISEPDLEKLASVSCSVVIKENVGYDFFAWKFGMELIGDLSHLDYLLLVNDSIIGPFSDLSMIFNKMNEKFDFWGLTENYEYKFHIQSYFLHANKAVLNCENWLTFWNSLVVYDNKSEIVLNYEVELTQVLKKNKDIRIGAWVSQEELTTKFPSNLYTNYPNTSHWHGVANPTVKHWKELLTDFKFPFIKKNLFFEKEHYHYVYEEQVFVYNVLPVNWKNIIGKTYGQEGVALIEEYVDEFTNNHDGKSVLTNACYKVLFIYNTLASSAQIDYLARWIQFYNRHNIETELILDSPYSLQACVDIKLRDITKINILSELSHKQFEQLKHRISQEDIGTIIIGDPESVKIAQYFSYTNAPHILISDKSEPLDGISESDYNYKLHAPLVVSPVANIGRGKVETKQVNLDPINFLPTSAKSKQQPITRMSFIGLSSFNQQKNQVSAFLETLQERDISVPCRLFFNADEFKDFELLAKLEPGLLSKFRDKLNCTFVRYENLADHLDAGEGELVISYFTDKYLPSEYLDCFQSGKLMLVQKDSGLHHMLCGNAVDCMFEFFKVERMADAVTKLLREVKIYNEALEEQQQNIRSYLDVFRSVDYEKLLFKDLIDFSELRKKEPVITVIFHFHFYSFDEVSFINYKKRLRAFYRSNINFLFSITEDSYEIKKHVASLKNAFPNCTVKIVPNKGRDIGAKFLLFDYIFKTNLESEYVIVMHDKKSLHLPYWEAKLWIDSLLKIIEPTNYQSILRTFRENHDVGIVGSEERITDCIIKWTKDNGTPEPVFEWNNDLLHKMIRKYNIHINDYNFVGGTMFWIKTELLRRMHLKYNFIEQYKLLEGGNVMDNNGSTVTHSWERLLCWLSTNDGYKVSKIN